MRLSTSSTIWTVVSLLMLPYDTMSLDNGLATTPPMGYRTWEELGLNISDAILRARIDAVSTPLSALLGQERCLELLRSSSLPRTVFDKTLADFGYTNVAVDDGWQYDYANASAAPGINGTS